jgi:ribonuclease PH
VSPRPRAKTDLPVGPLAKRPRAKQLTQAQLIRSLTKLAATQRTSRSTVQLDRGPRGQVLISVNVHQGDEPGLTNIAAVKARAVEIFDELCILYPTAISTGAE